MRKRLLLGSAIVLVAATCGLAALRAVPGRAVSIPGGTPPASTGTGTALVDSSTREARALAGAAERQVGVTVRYDASYVPLGYPGGDVPADRGVCTDVVVRAFRELGTDLQVAVHEDMSAAFSAYPDRWGLSAPDPNIDHRRVPNLRTYFARRGWERSVSPDGADYLPGDVVTWSVAGRPHIGIVSMRPADDGSRWCVVHNIGRGARVEDMLFRFEITGHYRPY